MEPPDFILSCPVCHTSVVEHHKDDVQTQWYICETGHLTANPHKTEVTPEQAFALRYFSAIEKHSEELANIKPQKRYPGYACFCDDPERQKGFKPARIAQWLAREEHFKTDTKTDILYFGDSEKGFWIQDGDSSLQEICAQIMGEENRVAHYNNIRHSLKGLTFCTLEFSKKIAVENGLLNVETGELADFTLNEMAFHSIPTKYDPTAKCPGWLEFLNQTLEQKDIPTLQEWSGYLLLPDYRFHKLLWIHGGGRNGKGVWQRTMEGILGPENVSGVSLEEFDGAHRFAMRQLYGKLFNPCSEPTTNRTLQTSLLKKATGQDTISAECKGTDKRITFRNTAKITVIANKFPRVHDESLAFTERRLFIKFPNEFTGKDVVPNLEWVWLDDPQEKSGILNWMLEGLHRLLSQGFFTESKSQETTEIEFERASDTISAFIKEMAIFNRDKATTRNVMREAYSNYCDIYGLQPESDQKLTQRLKSMPKVSMIRLPGKDRPRAWKGIELKILNDDGVVMSVPDVPLSTYSDISSNLNNPKKLGENRECGTSGTSGTENEQPYFNQCYFCGQPIWEFDAVTDGFTENKPAHRSCYEKKFGELCKEKKGEDD